MLTNNALQRGTILDSGQFKYKIIDVLGQGGFGITYLVVGDVKVGNVTTEAKFAIKEHFPSDFSSRQGNIVVPRPDANKLYAGSKSDFIAEAKKLHAMGTRNDNIVKVNEVFETNGTAYYVMQYINGQSLASYASSRGKLSYDEAASLFVPIIDAVDFLHKSRINHLDIKPDNIMLHNGMEGLTPVLIDFGLCVHFNSKGEKTTPKGVQGLSQGYAPLEQYAGIDKFMPEADVYALAATFLFCLTGREPQKAADLNLQDVRVMLSGVAPKFAVEAICRALNKFYENRTQTVAQFKAELGLGGYTGGKGSDAREIYVDSIPTEVINPEEDLKKKRRRRVFMTAAIAVVAVLCAVAGVVFWPKGKASEDKPVHTDSVAVIEQTQDSGTNSVVAETETQADNNSEVSTEEAVPEPESVTPDPANPQPVKPEPAQPAVTTGTLNLGYGTWTGGIKNGRPHGIGKLVFNSSHKVDRSSSAVAEAGYYFKATYDNGQLERGVLYDSSGTKLKTIIP